MADLPPPVGNTASTSRPPLAATTARSCPGRRCSKPRRVRASSRIASSLTGPKLACAITLAVSRARAKGLYQPKDRAHPIAGCGASMLELKARDHVAAPSPGVAGADLGAVFDRALRSIRVDDDEVLAPHREASVAWEEGE